MSIQVVKDYLKKYNLDNRVRELPVSSATVELAALALGIDGALIAKSMGLLVNDEPIIVVVAGDMKISNHKYKETFKVKAKMVPYENTFEIIGHAPGGVCPFAIDEKIKVYLDISLKRFEVVYPACGSSNSAIGLTIEELEMASKFIEWVDVCVPKC